jgi:hypothetical protein
VIDPATAIDSARVLNHHGPEAMPVLELVAGGGLPLVAGLLLARWRSLTGRVRNVTRASRRGRQP